MPGNCAHRWTNHRTRRFTRASTSPLPRSCTDSGNGRFTCTLPRNLRCSLPGRWTDSLLHSCRSCYSHCLPRYSARSHPRTPPGSPARTCPKPLPSACPRDWLVTLACLTESLTELVRMSQGCPRRRGQPVYARRLGLFGQDDLSADSLCPVLQGAEVYPGGKCA